MSLFGTLHAAGPAAVEIARSMMQAMGGEAAWQKARYIRFDFNVTIRSQVNIARKYLWDKQTGRCRLEDKSATGQPAVVLFNVHGQKGTAYVDGKPLEGAGATAAIQGAQRTFRTDRDWLDLPWRWLDAGVHLRYAGEKSLKEQPFDVVELTVDQPGGANAVRYTAYVSRRTHLLEHSTVDPDTSLWDWQYTTTGSIRLASDHVNAEKEASISMGTVQVLDKLDDGFLTDPARRLAQLR